MTSGFWRALRQMSMITHLPVDAAHQITTSLDSTVSLCSLAGVFFSKRAPLLRVTSGTSQMLGGLRCIAAFRFV